MTLLFCAARPHAGQALLGGCEPGVEALFVEIPRSSRSPDSLPERRQYHLAPTGGRGWYDVQEFASGLSISRMDVQQVCSRSQPLHGFAPGLRLSIVLSASGTLFDRHERPMHGRPGDILVRYGDPGRLVWRFRGGGHRRAVAIELPAPMLHTFDQEGADLSHLGARNSCTLLRPNAALRSQLLALAERMMSLPMGEQLMDRLELESLGLHLLLQVLRAGSELSGSPLVFTSGKPVPARWQRAVDEAVAVLQARWNQPVTISELARQVGINECYLKELFRLKTGSTIASYQRQQRMHRARALLLSGRCTVQQVALACGYARADKFAQAFRSEHGLLPSALLHNRAG